MELTELEHINATKYPSIGLNNELTYANIMLSYADAPVKIHSPQDVEYLKVLQQQSNLTYFLSKACNVKLDST